VADREKDNAREHLTEREREALKILAGEIVKEAMQQQPAEQMQEQTWLEGEKLEHETAKTQVLITVGLLGATGAAWFVPDPKHVWTLGFAVTFGIMSLGFALSHMNGIAFDLKSHSDRTWSEWRRFLLRDSFSQLSLISFTLATFFLIAYLIYNM
jgi:hypothetical protein